MIGISAADAYPVNSADPSYSIGGGRRLWPSVDYVIASKMKSHMGAKLGGYAGIYMLMQLSKPDRHKRC
jgi:hypothetical protein